MQRIFKLGTICALLIACVFTLQAQDFEGRIVYSVTYEDMSEQMAMYSSMLPKELTITIKGKNVRTEAPPVMGNTQYSIINVKDNKAYMLIDGMGQKIYLETDLDELTRESVKPKVTHMDETKEILGYKCKMAEVDQGIEGGEPITLYYTEKIPNVLDQYGDIKGFPLQFDETNPQFTKIMVAKEIIKEKVDMSKFKIPSGFKKTTKEELQKMTGGGM